MSIEEGYFSSSYQTAQDRFLTLGVSVGGRHIKVPLAEGLSHDYLWFGPEVPQVAYLHVAGTHGVEGFVGAAIQLAIFDQVLRSQIVNDKVAHIFLLALNPWGFKNLRRFNRNNVDLNRNFLVPWVSPSASDQYVKLNSWLNPATKSSSFRYYLEALSLIAKHGIPTLKQALVAGQASFPKGVYFCGTELQPEVVAFMEFLHSRLGMCKSLVGIEVHSGLGDFAKDTIFSFGHDFQGRAELSEKLGVALCDDEPTGVGIRTSGDLGRWFEQNMAKPRHHWLLQEFGTLHPIRVLKAVRDENAEYHSSSGKVSPKTQQQLLAAFCPEGKWRRKVVQKGVGLFKVLTQASCLKD